MDVTKKAAALQGRPYLNQSKANHTTLQSTCKRIIFNLALWGFIPPRLITWLMSKLGVRDE